MASSPRTTPAQASVPTDAGDATRRRLIDAAGERFAERGFRDTTVREICSSAGANIAAINYHFGDKMGLYRAVLVSAHADGRRYMDEVPETGVPEARLRAWVGAFLHKVLDADRPQWLPRLMMREMVEPTAALDEVIESSIRPQFRQLAGIVAGVTGHAESSALVRDASISIAGQCLVYRHCGRMLCRMHGIEPTTHTQIERLADTVTALALGGLRGNGERAEKPDRARPPRGGGR